MAIPPVTPLPTPPSRSRPDTFATEADAFLGALDTFGTQLDDLGDAVEAAEIATAASEAAAAASETAAAASEAAAATSETNASGSETAAAASAASAAASFDSFDDRYLGPKASDPTTDNDGDPLSGGMIYYNTGSGTLKLYNGSAWTAAVLDANGALLAANNLSDLTDTAAAIANLGISADPTLGTLTKSFTSGESTTITLSSSVSPTAVVAVTKEIGQTGVSSKGAWDVSATASNYELYDEAPATSLTFEGWGISGASFLRSFSVLAQDVTPTGVFFSTDGTKMYVLGSAGQDINEYNLSTAWNVSTASYSQNFSVSAQDTGPQDIFFKSDGTKMYVIGITNDRVYEYDLSTAWDISTASFLQFFSVAAQELTPLALSFKPDGTKMYVVGGTGDDVNEYDLSTAWDVSTASYSQNFSVASQENNPQALFFKPDGNKMYVAGAQNDTIYEYDLTTAWDISTASYNSVSFSVSAQESAYPSSMFFKADGSELYVVGAGGQDVDQYSMSSLTLGTGSFSASDVGKRIFVDDGGEATLSDTSGGYVLVSTFGSTSYTSGNWSLSGLDVDATNGITLSELSEGTWDVSSAVFSQAFSIQVQDTEPTDLYVKPDGTKIYFIGRSNYRVYEYNLSTPWDLSTMSFVQSYAHGRTTAAQGLFFKPDGSEMYICDFTLDEVGQWSLSTPWDVSTASYSQSFNVAAQDGGPWGLYFREDGLKAYVVGNVGRAIDEYNLSTAWDVTTMSFVHDFSVSAQEPEPTGVFFKYDGLKMYVSAEGGAGVDEYNLSTAWDVSTASYSKFFLVGSRCQGISFSKTGDIMFVITTVYGSYTDSVVKYDTGSFAQPTAQYLPAITSSAGQIDSTYWTDINSMTADDADNDGQVYYAVSTDDRTTWSIAKASDGVRPIVRNNGGTWEYNSDAGVAVGDWDVSTASFLQSFDLSAQDTVPTDVFFKPDGTKMYVTGNTGDDVNEYNLSTAWDISSASFLQNFSVAGQDNIPVGIFFKPDGLKMYVLGLAGVDINEYNLSTAWNISTASFLQNFSVYAQDTSPSGMFFRSDGLKVYVVGGTGDDVNEYDLSTAWNISTASFLQNFSVAGQDTSPTGVFFKPDGNKMYVVGQVADDVYEYDLSTAWDVSTASFLQNFSVSAQDNFPRGPFFKPDGLKMYVIGSSLYEYDIGSPPYSTSATWTSATINNEFASIAQAMTVAANQMDKAQLDAVTDGSHFTLGNTLDLAVVPYLASTGTAPTSDAVAINYDAAALNKGAILGTDYDYDVPAGDKVRITALATNNLKVRVV